MTRHLSWLAVTVAVLGSLACTETSTQRSKSQGSDNGVRTQRSFTESNAYEVVPVADGGAYAIAFDSIWYLRAGEAVRVKEVERLSEGTGGGIPAHGEAWALAMVARERQLRKLAESHDEEPIPSDR